jgi:hypothetical protein
MVLRDVISEWQGFMAIGRQCCDMIQVISQRKTGERWTLERHAIKSRMLTMNSVTHC